MQRGENSGLVLNVFVHQDLTTQVIGAPLEALDKNTSQEADV